MEVWASWERTAVDMLCVASRKIQLAQHVQHEATRIDICLASLSSQRDNLNPRWRSLDRCFTMDSPLHPMSGRAPTSLHHHAAILPVYPIEHRHVSGCAGIPAPTPLDSHNRHPHLPYILLASCPRQLRQHRSYSTTYCVLVRYRGKRRGCQAETRIDNRGISKVGCGGWCRRGQLVERSW